LVVKIAKALPLTAASRLASSKTILAPFPPSSNWTRFKFPEDACTIRRPVTVDPVQAIFCNPWVLGEMLPGGPPVSGHDVDHAFGETHFTSQLCDLKRTERGQLGWLQHGAVASGQRRPHLPTREHNRKVPWHDLPDYAEWLAHKVVQKSGLNWNHAALQFVDKPAEVSEGRGGARDVQRPGISDRMPGVDRFNSSQLFSARFDQVRELDQQATAIRSRRIPPRWKRARRGLDCAIDVFSSRLRDTRNQHIVVWIQGRDRPRAARIDEFAVYKELGLKRWGVRSLHESITSGARPSIKRPAEPYDRAELTRC
jgi:hypothetical protein